MITLLFADRMSGLGPDKSALTLLSQANLAAVLNKVRSNFRKCKYHFIFVLCRYLGRSSLFLSLP